MDPKIQRHLRLVSPLEPDLEALITSVIGACVDVHQALGPGLLERAYQNALAAELRARDIAFATEVLFPIEYRGQVVSTHRIDLIVDRRLIIEVKAVDRFAAIHTAQILSYLRVAGIRIGLLVNFNAPLIRNNIRRVIL